MLYNALTTHNVTTKLIIKSIKAKGPRIAPKTALRTTRTTTLITALGNDAFSIPANLVPIHKTNGPIINNTRIISNPTSPSVIKSIILPPLLEDGIQYLNLFY